MKKFVGLALMCAALSGVVPMAEAEQPSKAPEQAANAFADEVYWVRINYQKLNIAVQDTGSRSRFVDVDAGVIEFEEAGVYNLTLQPRDFRIRTDEVLVYLKSLRLEPDFQTGTSE
jgi:hypothetical protein